MLTYADFIYSLRLYLKEKINVDVVWRYNGYNAPNSDKFIAIEYVNSVFNGYTKSKEIITENIYLNLANISSDVISSSNIQSNLLEILLYHSIPLIKIEDKTIVGMFNVSSINSVSNIFDDSGINETTHTVRVYTDVMIKLENIKIYK